MLIWITVFIISIAVLVKGADWLLKSSEKIGMAMGLSQFIIGVVIVGIGTSFPEIVSSIAAVLKGATEIVSANAIGSNITNILLIIGVSSFVGKTLKVTKNLIDLDLPLLAISTALFAFMAWDGEIVFFESIILVIAFIMYLTYTIAYRDDPKPDWTGKRERKNYVNQKKKKESKPKIVFLDIILLLTGTAGLIIGAKYLIDSVVELSKILNIGVGVISLAAVALGTSLPELIVSIKAALKNKPEIALGNIFGSNIFNMLLVVGVPGLFKTLPLDKQTLTIGLPIMVMVTLLFVISGISRKIYAYEGALYLLIYIVFLGKLFVLF